MFFPKKTKVCLKKVLLFLSITCHIRDGTTNITVALEVPRLELKILDKFTT